MLLGFISLMLGVFQGATQKICVKESVIPSPLLAAVGECRQRQVHRRKETPVWRRRRRRLLPEEGIICFGLPGRLGSCVCVVSVLETLGDHRLQTVRARLRRVFLFFFFGLRMRDAMLPHTTKQAHGCVPCDDARLQHACKIIRWTDN